LFVCLFVTFNELFNYLILSSKVFNVFVQIANSVNKIFDPTENRTRISLFPGPVYLPQGRQDKVL
jgi:hypothetical protein